MNPKYLCIDVGGTSIKHAVLELRKKASARQFPAKAEAFLIFLIFSQSSRSSPLERITF